MTYPYPDEARLDILRMIPADGQVIGSVGCGSGATEWELVKAGREVHGVDVEPAAIDRAARRLMRWCRSAGLRPERWFDKYLSEVTPRGRWLKTADALSGRLFHEWFQMQHQVLARRS